MSQRIIDYVLNSLTPANPDASSPATVTGCTLTAGPGATILGPLPQALDFSANGKLKASLPLPALNRTKFCVRIVFKVAAAVTVRQNLVESDALPFALYLAPGTGTSAFHLVASVTTQVYGPGNASTEFLFDLALGTWYVADLVYDTDTVAVFLDGTIYSVHAFPDGTVANGTGDLVFAGIAPNGVDYQFTGLIAAIQLHADIPIELELQLDERRVHPQWYLTYKQEEIKSSLGFGEPAGEFYYDLSSTSWIQNFPHGLIMYQDANGQAFEMHGAILATYRSLPNAIELGYLISDEIGGAKTGSRKSLFSRAGIYWSSGTGAVPVVGQIWVDYESMGEGGAIGLPLSPATAIAGGLEQVFQQARMYSKPSASKAFEVHGAILSKYLASGGPVTWGFPVSNEDNIMADTAVIGRISEFERCSIYWSSGTGAFEVHGDIRDKYKNCKGPVGTLGFPTSDESDIPGAVAPARYNTFQHGSILWFGNPTATYVCLAFDITLGRVDTKESEGFLRGQNDVYMHATIDDNGHIIHSERIPSSGDSDGNNIYTVNKTFDLGPAGIVPNSPNRRITLNLDVWDSDWPDDDDHLGDYIYTLSMANAWGFKDNPAGLINSGSFDNINSITWAVSPRVNEALLTEANKWWGVQNAGTDSLTYEQYATAFSDVDSETEWWDPTDWLAELFYSAVVEGLAKNGNCFGMSLEAIYSKKHRSILRLPIDRFTTWEPIRNEFNIKHQYQVGAPAIWWFVAEFLSGQTHDPVSVFLQTRSAFWAGNDPVLCISQNYDFSGAPHCILPIGWNDGVKPWQILLHDPNFPSLLAGDPGPRTLFVDPDNNTYSYDGGNKYSGGEWSGGRLHYMPYCLVDERPRTPVFEAIMLLMTGVILILGADSETSSLTDENGVDLDAFGADSVNRLKAGQSLTNKFVSIKGFDQRPDCAKTPPTRRPDETPPNRRPRPHGVLTSEVHMRSEVKTFSKTSPPNRRAGNDWTRLTLKEYLCQVAPAPIREKFTRYSNFVAANQGRLMYQLADASIIKDIVGAAGSAAGSKVSPAPASYPALSKNFIHTIRGVRRGPLQYGVKHGLTQFMLSSESVPGEEHTIQVKDLGSHTSAITLKGNRDKTFALVVHNRLGIGSDHLRMSIENIPLAAGAELKINIKPGIGGVELVSAGQAIKATVTFDYLRRDQVLTSKFELNEQDGLRVIPSTLITSNQLKVSRINTLFGGTLSSSLVKPAP